MEIYESRKKSCEIVPFVGRCSHCRCVRRSSDYLGLPSGKVRLATLLLVLVGGLSIWVYILLWIVVPKGPKRLEGNSR